MNLPALTADLIRDEGEKLLPYMDTRGKITIGVGHNLTDRGISQDISRLILQADIQEVITSLTKAIPWWSSQPEPVQRVLANLAFNMGISSLLGFPVTLAHIKAGRYAQAADALMASLYAKQVGQRANRLAAALRAMV